MKEATVLDIFCGAGGFSEGFKQQGFKIVMGIDSWEPAIKTFNHNFGLNCKTKNVLEIARSIDEIEQLPDTDLIIGSPPCVNFSSSNRSGKANKSSGIQLIKAFLKIVAVKAYKPNSKLKAWLMENVINSANYVNDFYTFRNLGLSEWARLNGLNPNKKAIILRGNEKIINAAEFGVPQMRKRLIFSQILHSDKRIVPNRTHKSPEEAVDLDPFITLGCIKKSLPEPNKELSNYIVKDILYKGIQIKLSELSDHFYDTGLFECEWKQSKFLKTNHPYMGRMAFPENDNKPSRTITATNIGTSREAIIYKSEFNRKGNGEFRTPTIRELASLMSFPITYQFMGSEGIKCKLIGNAVCPLVSNALALAIRNEFGLTSLRALIINEKPDLTGINNLNTYSPKEFKNNPRRNKGSRFRRHPFKDGNITITMSNYDIKNEGQNNGVWMTSIQYGNGHGFPSYNIPDGLYHRLGKTIQSYKNGMKFLEIIHNDFLNKIGSSKLLQELYESQMSLGATLEPTKLIEELGLIINDLEVDDDYFFQNGQEIFKGKSKVPLKQLYALYAINLAVTFANKS